MAGPRAKVPKTTVRRYGWTQAEARIWRRIAAMGPEKLKAAMAGIGEGIIAGWRSNIQRGRSAEGPFKKLSPGYAAQKKREWGPQPILIASKQLYDSFAYAVKQTGIGKWKLEVGATGVHRGRGRGVKNSTIAQAHITGVPGRLPRRNFTAMPTGFMAALQSKTLRRILSPGTK